MRAFKNKLNVFAQQYIIEDYSLKIRENKKQEHKNVTKPLKENKNKDSMSVIEIFLKMRTLKKGIMLTLKWKHVISRKKKKKKNCYCKWKKLLNHLINSVEELENFHSNN